MLKREEDKAKQEEEKQKELGQRLAANDPEGYAECYPGIDTSYAMDDSDEEVDYTKMDLVSVKLLWIYCIRGFGLPNI